MVINHAAVIYHLQSQNGVLYLAQLDAVSVVLDLGIFTSAVDNLASFVPIAYIPCQVNILAILVVQRILDKSLVGLFPVAIIAKRQAGTGYG